MKIGIVFDSWKLSIFLRHLEAASLKHEPLGGVPAGTIGLHVITDNLKGLKAIIKAANAEAAATEKKSPDTN